MRVRKVRVKLGPNQGSKVDNSDGPDENIFPCLRSDSSGKRTSSALLLSPTPLTPCCWVSGFEHQDSGVITQRSSSLQTCMQRFKKTFYFYLIFNLRKKEITRFLRSIILDIKFENYAFQYWSPLQ